MHEEGVREQVIDYLLDHERRHYNADNERTGKEKLGFVLGDGWIMAYYMVVDDKTPENLMSIASAPGYSEMSEGDWNVYSHAWRDFLSERNKNQNSDLSSVGEEEKNLKKDPGRPDKHLDLNDIVPRFIDTNQLTGEHLLHPGITRGEIVKRFSEEINKLINTKAIPSFEEASSVSLAEFLNSYGDILSETYKRVIKEISASGKDTAPPKVGDEAEIEVSSIETKKERIRLKYGDPGWWENLPPELKWLEKYQEQGLPFEEIAPFLKSLTYEIEIVADAFPSF